MLNPSIAYDVLSDACTAGADFAELFVEESLRSRVELVSSGVDAVFSGIDFGIGVRLFIGQNVLYGHTNRTDRDALLGLVRTLISSGPSGGAPPPLTEMHMPERHPVQRPLSTGQALQEKVAYLKQVDTRARGISDKVSQVVAKVTQAERRFEIFNSEGLHTGDNRNYTRIVLSVVAQDGAEQTSAYEAPGALMGWEFHERVDPDALGAEVAQAAVRKLGAADCPSGELPVVIGPGFGGVIFHEACGHLLETTSVQKKASVFHDCMHEMIANPVVNAVDDGCLDHEWGSLNIDDEGMATQRTQLIKDGRLMSFLVDRMGAIKTGYARTGSGRRQDYRFSPASRMRNTFIEAGQDTLDEMIASIDFGIYAKKMGGGSVMPGTGEFNFAVREPYLIVNGKVTHALKSATLISTGPRVLKEISMVGQDFSLAAGMCGSISGSIPTTVGQPSLKVDRILVG
ncbi:MAG: TldD/PmbA family protein, partial [Myxococcota bacterium]|nr:TldD/PmbA family protein [Myxococcota bacterium]